MRGMRAMTTHPTPAPEERIRPVSLITVGEQDQTPAPLVRVMTCGLLTLEIAQAIVSTDPPQARYRVLVPERLRERGVVPALTLLKLLVSRPQRFAPADWLREQFCRGEGEAFSSKRLDTLAWLLRDLLCPPAYESLRRQIVAHTRAMSGVGYQLAGYPLVWVDHEALGWNVEQAVRMERFGDDPLPFWQRADALARRGDYLPDEIYSEWADAKREEIAGLRRQCVLALARLYPEREGKAGEEQALVLLRSYWLEHPRDEDVLRPLLELLGRRECYQEALSSYEKLCGLLSEDGQQPDPHTQDVVAYLRASQIRRLKVRQQAQRFPAPVSQQGFPADIASATNDKTKNMDIIRRHLLETSMHAVEIAPLLPLVDVFDNDILERFSQALMKRLHVDETTFRYLEQCTKQLWYNRQSAVFSSHDLYRPVSAHLQKMMALLEGALLPTERTRLCRLLSQTAQLLGELSLDMGYYAQGKTFHQAALVAAQEAEDHFLTAVSWGRISLACIYGKSHADGLSSIQRARSLAERHSTPMIQGWLAAIEAEIRAHLSQADRCLQALEHAEVFDNQRSSPLEDYLVRFDRSLLEGYQGVCFRALSRPEHDQSLLFLQKAQDSLREALVSLDPRFFQRKPTLLADLAIVSIYRQDIDEACRLISQAAALATHLHLQKVIERIIALREPLRRWKDLASVQTLDAHLAFLASQGNR